MFPRLWSGDSTSFLQQQYRLFWDDSLKVATHATEIYLQSWAEFFTSPQTLMIRNLSYFNEVMTPPQPAWQTNYNEVELPDHFAPIIKLLDFAPPSAAQEAIMPTLILPPQAGHHSYIADYSPEQSQTQTLRNAGLGRIYCIEWLEATQATRHTSIEDYIEAIHYCIQFMGGKANLVGDCQGGWLAAIYAALYPHTVNSLVVAGAPIDFQAGDGPIKNMTNYVASTYPDGGMSFYRALVQAGGGVLDGRWMVMGFNLMKPGQLPERYLKLYQDIMNHRELKRFREMKNWYDYPQDIAGDFYLWIVEQLFRDNKLIKGELVVGGRPVDLGQITCPVHLLGGTRDHITPPEQVFAMADYVGTPPEKVHQHLVIAGHIGLFMGREVLTDYWSPIGRDLAALSQPA